MINILYSKQEKDLLYSLIYNYLKYGKYTKAVIIINSLSFHGSDIYLLRCLLYSQIMLSNYPEARAVADRLRAVNKDINQDGWFMLMQSILAKYEQQSYKQ